MIQIPCPSSDSSSSSDSDDDEHLSYSKGHAMFKEVPGSNENKIHFLQNIVISNAGCSSNQDKEIMENKKINIAQEEIGVTDLEENEDKLKNETEDKIKLDNSKTDLSEQAEDKKVDVEKPVKKLSRIRQRHTDKWASNIRKECFDRGEQYISVRKKLVPARKIKTKIV